MLLPEPAPRKLLHTRAVTCRGYQREDGLWDIEGHLEDTKSYAIPNKDRDGIPADEPIHGMWMRLTLDLDLVIHDIVVAMEWQPKGACHNILDNFQKIKGLQIKPGFNAKVRELLGGIAGCTHLVELISPVATTAFQTMHEAMYQRARSQPVIQRPLIIDTCHMWRADGPIVQEYWPEFYTGKDAAEA
jgi:hypothetical protein